MTGQEHLERLWTSLLNLGARRLAALAFVGITVFAGRWLRQLLSEPPGRSRPLYVGLTQQDATRMGGVLREAGIPFDIASDGSQLLVPYGHTAQARMLLAERGLPSSANAGYELFDKLGPVGLTSFMQDITRVRALEGEIARTIQTMKGVEGGPRAYRAAGRGLVPAQPAAALGLGDHADGRRRHISPAPARSVSWSPPRSRR